MKSKVNTIKKDEVNTASAFDQKRKFNGYVETDNLGLDADGSSVNSGRRNYNNDNDRISHNPDGEDDNHDTRESPGYSPLMDK
ncbi:hypothetical protein HDF26_002420 [Pedobacter cryoconitis]|uniref:Uncharacterized protein n=1 Tax=Pedobacter cryoconitis TaxID=188932 RepID=A0A7W8ZIY5_9SPHI|nr:hypothetical protein [Pedobacter cryoconitis]MBB5634904.1 hypothetical protein [Pedobacter cryoconitis]MBB6271963.1 hypothetical protein [Pedobacter cryoconitis]